MHNQLEKEKRFSELMALFKQKKLRKDYPNVHECLIKLLISVSSNIMTRGRLFKEDSVVDRLKQRSKQLEVDSGVLAGAGVDFTNVTGGV